MSNKSAIDIRLKSIQFKSIWGSRQSSNYRSIVAIDDYEYVAPVGSGMMLFDNNTRGTRSTHLVNTSNNEILYVYIISSSVDLKYLATAIRMKDEDTNEINILVYTVECLRQEFRSPKKISYKYPTEIPDGMKLLINSFAFSNDNQLIACGTNFPSIGIIVFDHIKCTLFHSIPTGTSLCIPFHVTFNPSDSTRICVTGENNLFKFWRFTAKKVQNPATVNGLRGGKVINYTHHLWINDAVIVAASNKGFLCVIDGCEQKYPNVYASGTAPSKAVPEPVDNSPITQLLFRGDLILARSNSNEIAIFELRRVMQTKGINVQSPSLALLSKYRLSNVNIIAGMEWCIRNSLTSFSVVAMSDNCIFEVDIVSGDMGGMIGASTGTDNVVKVNSSDLSATAEHVGQLVDIVGEKALIQYHSEGIRSMSVAARTNRLATSSFKDGTVRIWDFNQPTSFASSWIIENYKDLEEENPLHVDIHPVGLFVAFATEGIVKEFAIADNQLQLYRRIDIKKPFVSPSGVAHVINHPVSLVRYSHGGQYLAVVTGKIAQIFNMYLSDYSTTSTGFPSRVMVMTDHISPITDIQFNRDDTFLYTTSSDGCVYGWKVGGRVRHQEFVYRGFSATRIALSKHHKQENDCYIIACFDSSIESNLNINPTELKNSKTVNKNTTNQEHVLDTVVATKDGMKPNTSGVLHAEEHLKKKHFLAIWKGVVSATPQMLLLDTAVKSLSLGETDGPDKLNICVLGLIDGRVLVSLLPLPFFRILDTSHSNIPQSVNFIQDPPTRLGFGSSTSKQKGGIISSVETENTLKRNGLAISSNVIVDVATESNSVILNSSDKIDRLSTEQLSSNFIEQLDDKRCRQLNLHVGSVNEVAITQNGMWIFTAGQDGTIYMYATNKRGLELTQIPLLDALENKYHLMDKTKLSNIYTQLNDSLHIIDSNTKDFELKLGKIVEEKNKVIDELQAKMQRELKHRDDAILQSRNEYTKLKTNVNSEIAIMQKRFESNRSELELMYEQKLSQESLYLDKLKQAYDEYVVHSRLDLSELQRKTDTRIETIENERAISLQEAEKQKNTVLQYFDYVKLRNEELLGSLEEKQVEERYKLKKDLTNTKKELSAAQAAVLTGEVHASRETQKLMTVIEEKESNLLKLQSNVDWAHNRIIDLEQALQKATAELVIRTEMSEKWELKTGSAQQKIIELEKLRKALTTQLHSLRQELGPKEETLLRVSEKLQETDREYEMSLHAIAEKEKALLQRGENLNLLSKQVRELRTTTARKEKVLRRAATLLEDYKFALKQAYFNAEKRTIVPIIKSELDDASKDNSDIIPTKRKQRKSSDETEVIEIIAQNEGMQSSLKRLTDVLIPFLNKEATNIDFDEEKDQVLQEQERHMEMLHRNVSILRANIDVAHSATESKVKNHLNDNQNLLKEVNNLRFEVRSLSMENQRLLAQIEFNNRGNKDNSKKNNSNENDVRKNNVIQPFGKAVTSSYDDLFSNYGGGGRGDDILEEEYDINNRGLHRIVSGALPPNKTKLSILKSESLPLFANKVEHRTVATSLNSINAMSTDLPLEQHNVPQLNHNWNATTLPLDESGGINYSKPISNKNEYNMSFTADDKIRKLMELNEQEIKSFKINNSKNDIVTSKYAIPNRSTTDSNRMKALSNVDNDELISLISTSMSKGIVLKGKESKSKPSTSNNGSITERKSTGSNIKTEHFPVNETSLVSESGGSSLLNVSVFSDSISAGQKQNNNAGTSGGAIITTGFPSISKSSITSLGQSSSKALSSSLHSKRR